MMLAGSSAAVAALSAKLLPTLVGRAAYVAVDRALDAALGPVPVWALLAVLAALAALAWLPPRRDEP